MDEDTEKCVIEDLPVVTSVRFLRFVLVPETVQVIRAEFLQEMMRAGITRDAVCGLSGKTHVFNSVYNDDQKSSIQLTVTIVTIRHRHTQTTLFPYINSNANYNDDQKSSYTDCIQLSECHSDTVSRQRWKGRKKNQEKKCLEKMVLRHPRGSDDCLVCRIAS